MSREQVGPTATSIADDVRNGRVQPAAVAREALDRIAARNDDLHAFVVVRPDEVLREADAIAVRADLRALPLAGVPVAIKDNVPVTGYPMRNGSLATSDTPAAADHPVVARLRGAGAVVVGLTSVPELCLWGATDGADGIARNPWNRDLTPGGSSGGAAAAVSSGMVPVAHGNDGMGSIRIPAANCGLVGIKPGLGLVPSELGNGSWFGMSENGPLTTTVADAALLLSVMADDPDLAYVDAPETTRIGVAVESPSPVVRVDPHFRQAALDVARELERIGHRTSTAALPYPASPLGQLARWTAGGAADAAGLDVSALQKRTRRHIAVGRRAARFVRPSQTETLTRRMRSYFESLDVVLTPALAAPPIRADRWSERGWAANMAANIRYAPFAAPWNLLGWPAVSVPAGLHPESGTPLAVQLAGPPGSERRLLALAAQIEQHRPWPRTAADR
ncbi:amidase [Rhodococcus sp. SORGH_AS_0303]|uniref:amidase n=1 Tax=Rhodococcus sp. SORGH_AS_0303 TaxID=3041753 RepID=UPI002789FCA5|nr:amidase [Rhodococcus sp. SORGH_AS_0303]MDQ1203472.1 amidase [Rhodococcus sp. SORGH_AS_0303]